MWLVILALVVIHLIYVVIYLFVVRPWQLHWGATAQEIGMKLPGDDLVERPDFNATRGVAVKALPQDIWKWIIQIGRGRAGWYGFDWLNNGGNPSADRILPNEQHIYKGQFISFTRNGNYGMWVVDYKPDEYILWTDRKGRSSWMWYLYIDEKGETRMLTRLRVRYRWRSIMLFYYLLFDFGDIFLMAKCMYGIKRRAEKAK